MASTNIFALLDNEDGGVARQGKGEKKAGAKAAADKKALPTHSFPGEQPAGREQNKAPRVAKADKDHHVTPGGARGGRGGARGGRGGRGGRATAQGEDHSVREFDRRGAPTKHAPKHAAKDGAALGPEGGAAAAVQQGESVAEAIAPEEIVEDVVIPQLDEVDEDDDGSQTYEQFLAAKAALKVEEDAARQIREVQIDESQFKPVKAIVREGEAEAAAAAAAAAERAANREAKKQRSHNVINLDEFRGGRDADGKYKAPFIGESRPAGGAPRGGRGGFAARGGRGGAAASGSSACYACGQEGHRSFECPTKGDAAAPRPARAAEGEEGAAAPAARGGRGGARGGRGAAAAPGACYGCGQQGHRAADCPTKDSNPAPRRGASAPRGGRGGFAPRGGRGGAAVPLNDKSAFPALGQ